MSAVVKDRGMRLAYESRTSACVRLGIIVRVAGAKDIAYHVKSESDDMGWVVQWNREDGYGWYTVIVQPEGVATKCNCPARVRCKHMDATEKLIARKLI